MKKARLFKFFKFVLLFFLIIFLVLFLTIIVLINQYPKEKVLALVTARAENILKRQVSIEDINISYRLKGIRLKNILIYNKLSSDNIPQYNYQQDKNFNNPDVLASVKDADIQFSLLPLLEKQFIIDKIFINKFKINITYTDGKSNLEIFLNDLGDNKENGSSGIKVKISSIGLRDCEINLNDSPEKLTPLQGNYVFDGTLYLSDNKKLSIADFDVILPEKRGRIKSDIISFSKSDDDYEIAGDFRLENCSLLWVYQWNKSDNGYPYTNFTGTINRLRITKEQVDGFVTGKSILTNSRELRADGQCTVNMKDKIVKFQNVDGEIEKSKLLINDLIFSYNNNIKDKTIQFHVTDIDSDINYLKIILSFLPSNIFGWVSGKLSLENKKYNGLLNFTNLSYRIKNQDLVRINGEIPIIDSNIHVVNVPAFIYDQPCQISVSTSGNRFQRIVLNIRSDEFNYAMNRGNDSEYNIEFSKVDIKSEITGQVEIGKFSIDKYNFSDVFVNYAFRNNILNLNRIKCRSMGGDINAEGYLDISRYKPYISLSTNFNGIKVQDIANLYEDSKDRVFGIAEGKADFELSMEKDQDIFESLKGKMEVAVDKGKFVNTGIQRGLSIWLAELEYKLKDIEFSKIYGNINIIGRTLYIKSALFNAPDIRFKADGYLIVPNNKSSRISGDVRLNMEFNDFFIQDIPHQVISRLITISSLKKQGDWYTKFFHLKGDDIINSRNFK